MRDYTKFFTPPKVGDFMADLLHPENNDSILEPNAGNGSLCRAVKKMAPAGMLIAVEIDEKWRADLKEVADIVFIEDFITFDPQQRFTACIANPPFGNEVDLQAHFDKMRELTIQGGNMVVLLPEDFYVKYKHKVFPIENWASNKDGSITPIKIVVFKK